MLFYAVFSRAYLLFHASTTSSDWFVACFAFVVIGWSDSFDFGFVTVNWNLGEAMMVFIFWASK